MEINWTEFLLGVIQNLIAVPLVLVIGYLWYRLTKKQDFSIWANKNIIPLWIFYLTLNSRLARIQRSILEFATLEKNASSKEKLSIFESWVKQCQPITSDDSLSLMLDLSKAELDSDCMVSYVSIWASHASGIGLPDKIRKNVLDLEEQVTEFNATFVRHSRILRELLQIAESSKNNAFIANQRNEYFRYFVGDLDRTVSTVLPNDFNKLKREKWTLKERLNSIEKAIMRVNTSHGEGMDLPHGSHLWHEEGNEYKEFTPMI